MERTWHLRNWFNLFHFKLAIVRKSVPLHILQNWRTIRIRNTWDMQNILVYQVEKHRTLAGFHIYGVWYTFITTWTRFLLEKYQLLSYSRISQMFLSSYNCKSLPSPDVHHRENGEVAVRFRSRCYLPWDICADITDTSDVRELCGSGHLTHISTQTLSFPLLCNLLLFPWYEKKRAVCCDCYFHWLRHYATSRKVANSSPDEMDVFNFPNPSSRTMALESTQPLTEMSTRNLSGGKEWPACKAIV
jgi:hypothetical protein